MVRTRVITDLLISTGASFHFIYTHGVQNSAWSRAPGQQMQAQTAARYEDILAHVTLTGAGSRNSRLLPIWDQTRVWDPGDI